jgi:hypothetical protein
MFRYTPRYRIAAPRQVGREAAVAVALLRGQRICLDIPLACMISSPLFAPRQALQLPHNLHKT